MGILNTKSDVIPCTPYCSVGVFVSYISDLKSVL